MPDNEFKTDDAFDLDKNYELAKQVVTDFTSDKPASAQDKINDIMVDKVRDVIAGKRLEVAQNLMNPEPEPEVEPEIEDEEDTEEVETESEEEVDTEESETETEEEDEDVQGD